jgi:AcrR family transcriptional regulator
MAKAEKSGRWQQRRRTRKDLLDAAGKLLKRGRKPSLEDIADEAMVSRATAYRYFTNVDALLLEAGVEVVFPDAADIFAGAAPDDAAARLERVDSALHQMIAENEVQLRLMLANALQQRAKGDGADMPVRQDRRTPLIEAAIAPARTRLKPADIDKLTAAMALIVGPEAMVVFRDVLRIDDTKAQKVRRWAIRALVAAATKRASDA